jgi:hypothetical protein
MIEVSSAERSRRLARVKASTRTKELAKVCARLRGVLRARSLSGEHGPSRLVEVEPTPADSYMVEERLPALYAEYLRHHHCKAFSVDFVLQWSGVSLLLVDAEGLDDATSNYANEEWPESWVVIGYEYEGCYFIDVESGEVGYLDHGNGLDYQAAGDDFVGFLEEVVDASSIEVESEEYAAIAEHDLARLEGLLKGGDEAKGCDEAKGSDGQQVRDEQQESDDSQEGDDLPDSDDTMYGGLTLLGAAVLHGAEEIVDWLLARGVKTETRNPAAQCTALGIAIGTGQRGMVLRLLERGVNPETTDDRGRTALMWATRRRDLTLISAALRAGAKPLPEGWLEEIEAEEARAAEARAAETREAEARAAEQRAASSNQSVPSQAKPKEELPMELYAVAIGLVLGVVIILVVLILDWLGLLG